MQRHNKNGTYLYKGKTIPIARIDVSQKHSFIEKEGYQFNDLPKLYVGFHERMFEFTENSLKVDVFLHFLNRIIDPVIHIEEEDQLHDFYDSMHEHQCIADFAGQIFHGLEQQ